MNKKLRILFLCTGNSCRSQMAEGWTNHLKNDSITAFSAGIEPQGLNQSAVEVMKEAGVDISGHNSKHLREFLDTELDYVVTVCDNAKERCPLFPGKTKKIHAGFADPPALAQEIADRGGSYQEQMESYRKVRDEIREFVKKMPDNLS